MSLKSLDFESIYFVRDSCIIAAYPLLYIFVGSKLQRGKTKAAGLKQLGTCLSLECHYVLTHVLLLQV